MSPLSLMAIITFLELHKQADCATVYAQCKSFTTQINGDLSTLYLTTFANSINDNVDWVYRKSLLYLVSRAFERTASKPLLGMKNDPKILKTKGLKQYISKGSDNDKGITQSTSHGGFDNDPNTINSILKKILKQNPDKPFTKAELKY